MFDPFTRAKIRAVNGCADKTIKAYPHVSEASKRRIEEAARSIGVTIPPSPTIAKAAATPTSEAPQPASQASG